MLKRILKIMFLLVSATIAFSANAQLDSEQSALIGDRPNAGGPAEEITIAFALLDIDEIDDKEQRFSIDAYFEIRWQDPRLALADASRTGEMRTYDVSDIWTPGLTIVNNRGLSSLLPEVVNVDSDGNAVIRQRMSGRLAVDLDLRKFPFDSQLLGIDIVSYRNPPSELTFSPASEIITKTEMFSADGWQFDVQEPTFSVFRLQQGGPGASRLTFAIAATRNAGFYVLTLALPMTLILFMAWTVHWLQPTVVPARMGMSTATVFSLIALGVSFRLSLPQIDYLTQADRFVMFSTLLVLVSLGTTVIATRWVNDDREGDAARMTVITRWLFPVIFALIVLTTIRGST